MKIYEIHAGGKKLDVCFLTPEAVTTHIVVSGEFDKYEITRVHEKTVIDIEEFGRKLAEEDIENQRFECDENEFAEEFLKAHSDEIKAAYKAYQDVINQNEYNVSLVDKNNGEDEPIVRKIRAHNEEEAKQNFLRDATSEEEKAYLADPSYIIKVEKVVSDSDWEDDEDHDEDYERSWGPQDDDDDEEDIDENEDEEDDNEVVIYGGEDKTELLAKKIAIELGMPYDAEEANYDEWNYNSLLHAINNGRGAEWVEDLEENGLSEELLDEFKELVGYKEDDDDEDEDASWDEKANANNGEKPWDYGKHFDDDEDGEIPDATPDEPVIIVDLHVYWAKTSEKFEVEVETAESGAGKIIGTFRPDWVYIDEKTHLPTNVDFVNGNFSEDSRDYEDIYNEALSFAKNKGYILDGYAEDGEETVRDVKLEKASPRAFTEYDVRNMDNKIVLEKSDLISHNDDYSVVVVDGTIWDGCEVGETYLVQWVEDDKKVYIAYKVVELINSTVEDNDYDTETFFDTKEEAEHWVAEKGLTDYSIEPCKGFPEGDWHVWYHSEDLKGER